MSHYCQDSPYLEPASETELGWAAGFFDGEGSFTRSSFSSTGKGRLQLHLVQKDVRPLIRFQNAVGTKLAMYKDKNGCTRMVVNKQGLALSIINLLWPYLSEPKKEQAIRTIGRKGN